MDNSFLFRSSFGLVLAGALAACAGPAADDDAESSESALTGNTSGYTSLEDCTFLGNPSETSVRVDCGGMGDYGLVNLQTEESSHVILKTAEGEHYLRYVEGVPHLGMGILGPKAEWRGPYASPGKTKPKALIYRQFNFDPEGHPRGSTLVVSKLGLEGSCIYALVDGTQAGANERARVEADRSDSITCPLDTPVPNRPSACGSIPANTGLAAGESISSCGGKYNLVMQFDGNLVLYKAGGRALWSSRTVGTGEAALLRPDGNFVVWGRDRDQHWAAQTAGNANATAWVQDDGNLVVYAANGRPVWASNTVQH